MWGSFWLSTLGFLLVAPFPLGFLAPWRWWPVAVVALVPLFVWVLTSLPEPDTGTSDGIAWHAVLAAYIICGVWGVATAMLGVFIRKRRQARRHPAP